MSDDRPSPAEERRERARQRRAKRKKRKKNSNNKRPKRATPEDDGPGFIGESEDRAPATGSNPYAAPRAASKRRPVRGSRRKRASAGQRLAHFVIDSIVCLMLMLMCSVMTVLLFRVALVGMTAQLVAVAILLSYYAVLESIFGVTLGKLITRTEVIHDDGSKPTPGRIMIRTLCRFIPFDSWSFFRATASGWHDTLSQTRVVKRRKRRR